MTTETCNETGLAAFLPLPSEQRVLPSLPRRLLRATYRWQQRERERRALAALDDHLLRDIGLSRPQALFEANKSFWQA